MTDRTFRQHALGFGTVPAQVTFQINGNTLFAGSVTTVDEPYPELPNLEYQLDNVAWSWTNPADFEGTQQITISVNGSDLLLADTSANNPAGNLTIFGSFYSINIDEVTYKDPFSNEAIDGITQSGPYDPAIPGQWWWFIPAGSTFSATLHVNAPPPLPPA